MLVTVLGITTVARLEQPEKAYSPMVVMPLGKTIDSIASHSEKAYLPIDFTSSPIVYFFTWVPKISFIELELL
jgi:hypothetical protein